MTEAADTNELVLAAADTGWMGKNDPGILTLVGGRLRFETPAGTQFDVPVAELAGGKFSSGNSVFKVTIAGRKYRLYFGERVDVGDEDTIGIRDALRTVGDAKQAGTLLRNALGV